MIRLLPLALLAGCGFIDAGVDPVVEAHRGAAGYWPQNSRTAMLGSIDAGYGGLEFDLVLTADGVPVLSHDPWLHEELCTTADGGAIEERIFIQDLDFDTLQADYLCGGVEDPENPDAELVAETVMSFDELLEAMVDAPEMLFHIDVKYEPEETPAPEVFAEEIMSRFVVADLPNPWFVSANLPELVQAFEAWGDEHDVDVPSLVTWPRFTPETSDVAVAIGNELGASTGLVDMASVADAAGADGVSVPFQVIDRQLASFARDQGYFVAVWTVNDEALLQALQGWPIDAVITDYPERAR